MLKYLFDMQHFLKQTNKLLSEKQQGPQNTV